MFIKVYHEFNQLPSETTSSHVMLHMEAPSVLDKGLPPKNFIFIIDTSSSMSGEKLKQCKDIITKGMRLFRSCDKIALISYSDVVAVQSDWTNCDDVGKRLLQNSFNGLHACGCTNISGAVFKGLELASKQSDVTVVFLTDGNANRGIEDKDTLAEMTKKIIGESNIRIHTIGVGTDHSVDMLQKLSLGGTYTFVETPESTTKAFGSILGSAYSTVFQNLKVEITGKNVNFTDEFNKPITQYDIGDLYAEEKRDLLAKASYASKGPYEVTWKVSGVNIVDKQTYEKSYSLVIERGEDNKKNEEIKKRLEYINAASAMKTAILEAKRGNVESAKHRLRSMPRTDCPVLSRAMNVAEQSMDDFTRGGMNRIQSLQMELLSQRGTSDVVSTPWQRKVASAIEMDVFNS
jgi:uncharacterized protein YegL